MKCQAVYERALSLLDSITKQGALNVNAEENQEYKVRAPSLIDIIQRELMFDSSNTKIFEVSLPKIKNLLGNNFEEYEFIGNDLVFETEETARAYYFEVNAPCTVEIWYFTVTNWTLSETIQCINEDGYKSYSGALVSPYGASKTKFVFKGHYHFKCANIAFYDVPYRPGSVPDYRPYHEIEMPNNIREIVGATLEQGEMIYKDLPLKFEKGRSKVYVKQNTYGRIRIEYRAIPNEITSLEQELEVDDRTASIMSYKLAELLVAPEMNEELAERYRKYFDRLKEALYTPKPTIIQPIIDVYGCDF